MRWTVTAKHFESPLEVLVSYLLSWTPSAYDIAAVRERQH